MKDSSYSYQFYSENPIFAVIILVIALLCIIGMWKVFKKAGIPGWHSLIPILNTYDFCKIALRDSVGLFTVLCIFLPIVYIYPCIKMAHAFGKGTGFGVCLMLFGFITIPMLGFGDAEYLGPQ